MNWKFWVKTSDIYDEPINKVLEEMRTYGADTPEFQQQLEHLERLTELKAKTAKSRRISPDTAFVVLGNLAGLALLGAFEQKHVMNSKGMSWIKPKQP